jgi:hypothetical protein
LHVADELAVVPPSTGKEKRSERLVLVRARVRHVDHETVYLPRWSKVARNTEPLTPDGVARMDCVRWVD